MRDHPGNPGGVSGSGPITYPQAKTKTHFPNLFESKSESIKICTLQYFSLGITHSNT